MDYIELIKHRHSVRAYLSKPVPDEAVQAILAAANQAPSAGNLQAYEIYLVTRPSQRAALAQAAKGQEFLAQAPIVLVFCAHPKRSAQRYNQRGSDLYALQDATIACTFAMLAATALGLATVWVGAFDDESVHRAIQADPDHLPVAILPIGYAADSPGATQRRPLSDLVHEPKD
jgi:nitroreductase